MDKDRFKSSKQVQMDTTRIPFSSTPIQDLSDDCETCVFYYLDAPRFCEGGKCKKHECSCGYGFTCNDYEKMN